MFGPNISGGDACSPVQTRGILARGDLGPLEQEYLGFPLILGVLMMMSSWSDDFWNAEV